MKRKKQELQSFVDGFKKKVEKCYDKAKKDHCTESVMKGNSFQNSKGKKETILKNWKTQKFSLRVVGIIFVII